MRGKHLKKKKKTRNQNHLLDVLWLGNAELGAPKRNETWLPASAAFVKYSSTSLIISARFLLLIETSISGSVAVSFEHPLTTEGAAAATATSAMAEAAATSDAVAASNPSPVAADLEEVGEKGSQKFQLEGGGDGGGTLGEGEVNVSEPELIG